VFCHVLASLLIVAYAAHLRAADMPDDSSSHCAHSKADHPAAWHNELPTGASIESENAPI
jgi:hypothetical protein